MESETVYTGAVTVQLLQNAYAAGDTVVLEYKTAATEGGIAGASWTNYAGNFVSLGYVKIKVTHT
jgi:hypothetical protein